MPTALPTAWNCVFNLYRRGVTTALLCGVHFLACSDHHVFTKETDPTVYHSQANGMVECLHWQLKTLLKAWLSGTNWMRKLPLVFLSIRVAWRKDARCSDANLVYRNGLKLPGEFFCSTTNWAQSSGPPTKFPCPHRDKICSTQPPPPQYLGEHPTYKPLNLAATGFVYVHLDVHSVPLQPDSRYYRDSWGTVHSWYQRLQGCCVHRSSKGRLWSERHSTSINPNLTISYPIYIAV